MRTLLLWLAVFAVACTPREVDAIFGIRLTDILRPRGRGQAATDARPVSEEGPTTPASGKKSTTQDPRRIVDIPQSSKCPAGQRWAGGQCRVDIGKR